MLDLFMSVIAPVGTGAYGVTWMVCRARNNYRVTQKEARLESSIKMENDRLKQEIQSAHEQIQRMLPSNAAYTSHAIFVNRKDIPVVAQKSTPRPRPVRAGYNTTV